MTNYPAIAEHATAKKYVDQCIDNLSFVRNNKNNDFNNHSLSNISQITLNSEPTYDNHAARNSYVDSPSENDRNQKQIFGVFNDKDIEFDKNRSINFDSIKLNRNPNVDNEASNK